MSLLATHFLDVVRGLPTLRAFNRGEAQIERIERSGDEYRTATMGTLRLAFLSGTVLELAATLGVALVAVTVGVRLVEGGIAFEPALTVLVLAPELYLPLRNLAAGFHASADGIAVADRLLGLIEAPAVVAGGAVVPPSLRSASIWFDGVSFSYPDRPSAAVSNVDLELSPGETVALVGQSGGGKSTLASLLLRFREPSDGRRPRGWPRPGGVRSGGMAHPDRLGAAEPDAVPWLGSGQHPARRLRRIRRGGAGVRTTCRRGLTRRGAPGRLRTLSGKGTGRCRPASGNASALARAFLRDAPLVVLDEPTANLDPSTAELVAEAIARLRLGRTVLLIAHDARLAAIADRTITDRGGRIVEGGDRMSATLRRLLGLAAMPRGRSPLSVALAASTILLGVGLIAASGYLISRAAEHPPISLSRRRSSSSASSASRGRWPGTSTGSSRTTWRRGRSGRSASSSTLESSRSRRRSSKDSAAVIS